MSDRDERAARDERDEALPPWVVRELRAPVATDPEARRRVMARVRAVAAGEAEAASEVAPEAAGEAAGEATRRGPAAPPWARRSTWRPRRLSRTALMALLAAVVGAGALWSRASLAPPAPVEAALRDTLRIVRFMLVAPGAARVALAGDFNAWDPQATPLLADSGGVWWAAVALAPGQYRYSFVVDDTQWVRDPAAAPAAPYQGRPAAAITVGRTN